MIDSGASVNVSHRVLEHHTDERVRLGGADGKPHQGYGTPQLWLKIGTITKRYEFQMSAVTKSVVSVSSLCESGVEVRFNKKLFLNCDEDCAPLFKMVSATSRPRLSTPFEKRGASGAVEAVMSEASGEVKKNGSCKLAGKYVQPMVEDPVAGENSLCNQYWIQG